MEPKLILKRMKIVAQRARARKAARAGFLARMLKQRMRERIVAEKLIANSLHPYFKGLVDAASVNILASGQPDAPAAELSIHTLLPDFTNWVSHIKSIIYPRMLNVVLVGMDGELRRMNLNQKAAWAKTKVFCPTGPGGGVDPSCRRGGGSWAPTMAAADAARWSEGSKWSGTFHHVTAKHNVESIKKEGFRPANGTMGNGIYLNANMGDNAAATGVGSGDAVSLNVRVRVKNVLDVDLRKGGVQDWQNQPDYVTWTEIEGGGTGGDKGRRKLIDAGYDAVRVRFGSTGDYRLVLDPKSIVVIDDGQKSTTSHTKASTATQLIQDIGGVPVMDGAVSTPYGDVSIGFLSEYPPWMRKAATDLLEESFDQDYWARTVQSITGDIEKYIKKAVVDGWSIGELASKIRPQLLEEGKWATARAKLIARTETGHALNGARSMAIDNVVAEMHGAVDIKKLWHSVLGTTTRDSHAEIDGVPADKDGFWYVRGHKCRWPGDAWLPAEERCNCQCTIVSTIGGVNDQQAAQLIADYDERIAGKDYFISVKGVRKW
jgi:hypothetical protein